MAEKIATREAYGKALAALADKYPELVCFDADLAGATMTKFFKAACPERFFDMGIAEADMVGVAAGMSLCGFKPFVNTFAMFAAGRAWEQVRNSVAYPHLNVKVVGSPRRSVRRRRRRDPPVHRGFRHHARDPRHDWSCARATATRCGWLLRRSSTTRARPTCVWAVWRSRP